MKPASTKHSWKADRPRKGWSTCSNCSLEVKTYKIKKGNLPRCDPKNALKPKSDCENHMAGAISGAKTCWYCGRMYSKAELELGKQSMEELVEKAAKKEASEQPESPPQIVYK